MLFLLVCLATLVTVLIGLSWHRSLYWRRRSIPGPESQLFFGNLIQMGSPAQHPTPLQLAEWTRQYGSLYGIQRGHSNALVTTDYELARQVFHEQFENFHERDLHPINGDPDKKGPSDVFGSRGLRWKRLRTLTSLIFTTKSLKRIFPIISTSADQMCKDLDQDMETHSVIDISGNLKEYTADIILRSAFSRHENRKYIQELIVGISDHFKLMSNWLFHLTWIVPPVGGLLGLFSFVVLLFSNKTVGRFLKQMLTDVRNRKKEKELATDSDPTQPTDFIDLLMEAESDEVVVGTNENYNRKNAHIEKRLTVDEIIGSCFIFLFAGYDTTASTLAFTLYFLARHPECQERLRAEIEECCPNEELDYDSLTKLKYADAVFQETLRLRPTGAMATSRKCTRTTKIGDLEIEKGTAVILDVITMQRDKKVFGDDAEEFRPDR